jgi:hypothetical protein
LRISTTARRAVQTLIGSKDALRTKTRAFILKSEYSKQLWEVASAWQFVVRSQ